VKLLALFLVASFFAILPVHAQRETTDLPNGWKFIKQDIGVSAPTDSWEKISIPHTWNNLDGQDGKKAEPDLKDGYYRGACWYARALDVKPEWKSKRVFLRFEAASTVAQVYLNGQLLGEHRGGFTAFCFELTGKLRFDGPNELRVRVDNSRFDDVPPLAGDFDVMGGIYRPVHLIVTDPVCISPLDFGSPGVYLTTTYFTDAQAAVDVKTLLSNGLTSSVPALLDIQIIDADQRVVAKQNSARTLAPGETQPVVETLRIDHPHSWNGRKDPYLYTVVIHVVAGPGAGDAVTQPLGLRTVAITNEQGFLLNGQSYPIHGVNYHQDRRDKGWAVSDADHDEDMKLILDMGVTAIRLAHYPQSEYVHDLADRNGILLWNEISLVNAVRATPEFKANASQQLHEMILQRYNHPSAAFWGLFNELDARVDGIAVPLLQELKREQIELDPTRLSVSASCVPHKGFNAVPDWICFNPYFGWYYDTPDKLTAYINDRYHDNGDKRIGLSEYGAGANPAQHAEEPLEKPKAGGPVHPEEWQAYVHEQDWAQIKNNPKLWGSFLWCMFDFASDGRNEGGHPGVNDKGMVTADRATCKDAYFFYQANWTDTPMLHLNSRRFTDRHQATTTVEVYSNASSVELKFNGKSLGAVTPDDLHICRWKDVSLQKGNNVVEVNAPGTQLTDRCEWNYTPSGWF
jgi:beta-galactosidase